MPCELHRHAVVLLLAYSGMNHRPQKCTQFWEQKTAHIRDYCSGQGTQLLSFPCPQTPGPAEPEWGTPGGLDGPPHLQAWGTQTPATEKLPSCAEARGAGDLWKLRSEASQALRQLQL